MSSTNIRLTLNKLYYPKNEKVILNNIDLSKNIKYLRGEISKRIKLAENEFEIIFLGTVLVDDDAPLESLELRHEMAVIHVAKTLEKNIIREFDPFDDEKITKVTGLFKQLPNSIFRKIIRPENLKRVLTAFPEFRHDIIAFTILKDPVLLSSLQLPETFQKLNENHPVLVAASELIFEILFEEKEASKTKLMSMITDELSDSSSSSDNTGPSTSRDVIPSNRRITMNQLASALANTSNNSLSNIASRSVVTDSDIELLTRPSSSRITPLMFSNALSRALTNSTPPTPSTIPNSRSGNNVTNQPTYTAELEQMREIGLTDDALNYNALLITHGNIDEAVSIIFSGRQQTE